MFSTVYSIRIYDGKCYNEIKFNLKRYLLEGNYLVIFSHAKIVIIDMTYFDEQMDYYV
jgi:hypothetical protein